MKAYKKISLLFLCIFSAINFTIAQNLIKDGQSGYYISNIYETGDNDDAKIGVGKSDPTAKFHISAKPDVFYTLFEIDAICPGQSTSRIGSIENWKTIGNIYYGIYRVGFAVCGAKEGSEWTIFRRVDWAPADWGLSVLRSFVLGDGEF